MMHTAHSIRSIRPLTRLGALLAILCAAALAGPFMSSASASAPYCFQSNGKTTCIIAEPDVQHQLTSYPGLYLFAGERVTLSGGGCYQTGGHGRTWKRFVNPISSNGEYQAEVWIPGTISRGTPLRNIENVTFTTQSPGVLSLGVNDSGPGDNGYWGHDDGTYDQCKNVGNAWFRIVIG